MPRSGAACASARSTRTETARVKATLNDIVTVANPLDYHTFAWAKEEAMTATFSAMIGCGFDLSMLVLDFPRLDRCSDADWDFAVRAIAQAAKETGGRTAVVASLPENMPEERAAELMAAGIVPLCGDRGGARRGGGGGFHRHAMEGSRCRTPVLAYSAAEWFRRPDRRCDGRRNRAAATGHSPSRGRRLFRGGGEGERWLTFGVHGAGVRARSSRRRVGGRGGGGARLSGRREGARRCAQERGGGGPARICRTRGEVEQAAQELAPLGTGLLVEAMVTDAVAELLIGVTRDPQFGLLMTIGAGGVLVELLGDSASLLLPASEDDIRAAILSLKTAPLLQGFRGRPVGDLSAAVAAALAIARFAEAQCRRRSKSSTSTRCSSGRKGRARSPSTR